MTSIVSAAVLVRQGAPTTAEARVIVEEPLEIRVAGETLAITMRTPGSDPELVLGFLLAEGLIASARDVGRVYHCGRSGEEGYGNVIDVTPAPGTSIDLERLGAARRGTLITSACGVCGRRTVDDLLKTCAPLPDGARFSARAVASFTDAIASEQRLFTETGGAHAAGLVTAEGRLIVVREDVGRHNAVDKAVGRLLLDGVDPSNLALVVSGRSSFEIVQKAARARIPVVVGVSAPTSLSIRAAQDTNVTLVGFARGGGFNVYSAVHRIAWQA